jgi:hypothetical protein
MKKIMPHKMETNKVFSLTQQISTKNYQTQRVLHKESFKKLSAAGQIIHSL